MEHKDENKDKESAGHKPEAKAEAPAPAATPPPPPDPKLTMGKGKTVLVVDDDPGSIELLKGILEKVGFEVVGAAHGKEGLTKISITKPSLIIIDVLMPEMDGFTFFKELKKNKETENIPALILTVRKNMEDSFMALGAQGFISKPVDTESLLTKIQQISLRPKAEAGAAAPKPEEKK